MSRKTKLIASCLILVFILTGFFREFVFLNVNEQMRVTYYKVSDSHVAPGMMWLNAFSYTTLYYMKWLLTAAFTFLFAILSAITIKVVFNDKKLVRIGIYTYGIVFLASFFFFLVGAFSGNTETTYSIARFLAGLIESPAMLIILLSAFTIIRRN
jgi:hypothetical protein